jgi:hypothetical protein
VPRHSAIRLQAHTVVWQGEGEGGAASTMHEVGPPWVACALSALSTMPPHLRAYA